MILFYVLVATMPLVQHPFWGRYVGSMTITKYLGAACLVYAAFCLVTRRRKLPALLRTPQSRWFCAFLVAVTFSVLLSPVQFSWASSEYASYISFLLLFLMTVVIVDSVDRLRSVLLVCMGSVAWASLYVIREWQKGSAEYGLGYRPGWVTGDANYFAACAVVVVPLCIWWTLNGARWHRVYAFVCLLVTIIGIVLSASRGGLLALVAGVLVLGMKSKRRAKTFILTAAILGIVVALTPASPLHRFLQPTASDSQSANLRVRLWTAALKMIRDHPIAGVGIDNFASNIPTYGGPELTDLHVAHNTYLQIAAEAGMPTLLAYIGMLMSALAYLSRLRRQARNVGAMLLSDAAIGIQAGLCGVAVAGMFMSAQMLKMFWLMIALSASLQVLLPKHVRPGGGKNAKPGAANNTFCLRDAASLDAGSVPAGTQ